MVDPRHRRLVVCRGDRSHTATAAMALVVEADDVLWVGQADGVPVDAVPPAAVARRLGGAHQAVVLDFHEGFHGDTLGRAHGLVRGGGVLVLRLPDTPLPGRMGRWVEHHLTRTTAVPSTVDGHAPPPPIRGTPGQAALVAALSSTLAGPGPTTSVVVAGRGRGKSAGVGLALAALPPRLSIALTGPHKAAVQEVVAFSGRPGLAHIAPFDLLLALQGGAAPHVVVVDEAARVPVPLLRALYRACPTAHFVFATTTHGYEGCGRGFSHRFVPWLAEEDRPVHHHSLVDPIRWAAGDPLERWVFEVLALDAAPAPLTGSTSAPRVARLHRDRLLAEPALLHDVFGLLVAAHYRTTPADLHHLLDDPGVALHTVSMDGRVVAVGWLVADGALDAPTIAAVQRGQRLRGFALAESFICHAGRPDAARLKLWRSVRTAVHPRFRGQGLARLLIEHEHAHHHDADLIGTLFGATPQLVRMRRALGYTVVRLGSSRNARSGVPSVLMVRAHSAAAHALVAHLRADFARDLPAFLARLQRGRGVPLSGDLVHVLQQHLPTPSCWTLPSATAAVGRYAAGAAPIDALGAAPAVWLAAVPDWSHGLPAREATAVRLRVLDDAPWIDVARGIGAQGVHVAQRAVRRGIRAVWMRTQASALE